jgi:transcriptional regulator of heat shock response
MEDRKNNILNIIIKEHIKTGAPVGSEAVTDRYKLNVSSATVRNVMGELEDEGYIRQPYTSAGRIPTEKAYNYFIANLSEKKVPDKEAKYMHSVLAGKIESDLKNAAKALAKFTGNAIFWAFYRHNLYYTGISNLFAQPEFTQSGFICQTGAIIDRLDEIIDDIFEDIKFEPEIMIGSNNPFGNFCGTIITKYKHKNDIGVFGILGPMRMDYEKNLSLIKLTVDELTS